jgi:ATP-dependent DNA helicase RecG
VDLVIGTHTLITAGLAFHDLGLAVIDEQHRFGVAQRLALRSKANQPDLLVLTATPIPRSLALTLYGDLDLSLISQSPPGRPPIQTQVFSSADRNRAYQILAREIRSGGRAYVVAPRIAPRGEENGTEEDWASAEDIHDFIRQKVLDPASVGLVHGRMKPEDRQGVLCAFRQGRLKCLVATTVIEVGVDVPEASLMLIEDAHRFGLAQLHQLRGRVGRGERASLCLLVAGGETETGAARLAVMARSTNGFELAEEDLRLRGPGDPLGLRQSGLPHLAFARLPKDLPLLLKARGLAEDLIGRDPELLRPEFKLVREMVDQTETRVQADPAGGG